MFPYLRRRPARYTHAELDNLARATERALTVHTGA